MARSVVVVAREFGRIRVGSWLVRKPGKYWELPFTITPVGRSGRPNRPAYPPNRAWLAACGRPSLDPGLSCTRGQSE